MVTLASSSEIAKQKHKPHVFNHIKKYASLYKEARIFFDKNLNYFIVRFDYKTISKEFKFSKYNWTQKNLETYREFDNWCMEFDYFIENNKKNS